MSERVYLPQSTAKEYRLGNWTLCVHSNSLKRDGVSVELENRVVMLLLFFIDHPGEVLDKERIIKTLWQGKVVNDDSLAVAVSQLRKALADNSRAPEYIKTIPGVGYQFIATAAPVIAVVEDKIPAIPSPLPASPFTFTIKVMVVVLLIPVLIAGFLWLREPITVLPKTDVSSEFAQAMKQVDSWEADDIRAGVQALRHILEKNPNHAEAYAAIAHAKIRLSRGQFTLKKNCAEVMGLLDKAITLEDKLVFAWRLRGDALFWCKHDYAAAELNYQQAITLKPDDSIVPLQYAQLLLAQGRFAESSQQVDISRQHDPLNYSMTIVVWIYQMQRRDDLALQELERIISSEKTSGDMHISAQRVYASLGRNEESFAHWLLLMREGGFSAGKLQEVQQVFTAGGLPAVSRWLLAHKVTIDVGQYTPPLSWARYALDSGELDDALVYLEQAAAAEQLPLLWANVDPAYDQVRSHPRFQAIVKQFQQPVP